MSVNSVLLSFRVKKEYADIVGQADFRAAIKATNRTQIIIAGIVTDVCTYNLPCGWLRSVC